MKKKQKPIGRKAFKMAGKWFRLPTAVPKNRQWCIVETDNPEWPFEIMRYDSADPYGSGHGSWVSEHLDWHDAIEGRWMPFSNKATPDDKEIFSATVERSKQSIWG